MTDDQRTVHTRIHDAAKALNEAIADAIRHGIGGSIHLGMAACYANDHAEHLGIVSYDAGRVRVDMHAVIQGQPVWKLSIDPHGEAP